jgi:hypothetical protein
LVDADDRRGNATFIGFPELADLVEQIGFHAVDLLDHRFGEDLHDGDRVSRRTALGTAEGT